MEVFDECILFECDKLEESNSMSLIVKWICWQLSIYDWWWTFHANWFSLIVLIFGQHWITWRCIPNSRWATPYNWLTVGKNVTRLERFNLWTKKYIDDIRLNHRLIENNCISICEQTPIWSIETIIWLGFSWIFSV